MLQRRTKKYDIQQGQDHVTIYRIADGHIVRLIGDDMDKFMSDWEDAEDDYDRCAESAPMTLDFDRWVDRLCVCQKFITPDADAQTPRRGWGNVPEEARHG